MVKLNMANNEQNYLKRNGGCINLKHCHLLLDILSIIIKPHINECYSDVDSGRSRISRTRDGEPKAII